MSEEEVPVTMPYSRVADVQQEINRASFLIGVSHNWPLYRAHLDADHVTPDAVREHLQHALEELTTCLADYNAAFPPQPKKKGKKK